MILLSFQKTLALLLMPAGFVWLLLLGAGVLALLRKRRRMGLGLLALALVYAVAGNPYVGAMLMARLEAQVPVLDLEAVAPFDAVFVLGGGTDMDPLGGPELGCAGDRLCQAARLWHAGKARLLVTSGCGMDGIHGFHNGGEETRTLWLGLGVPDHAILVVQDPCWVTQDEIAAYRRLQERFGWQRMALVSSASHLPRALGLARKAGLAVTPVGADWQGRSYPFQARLLVPQGEGFLKVHRACWEYVGRLLGR